MISYKLALQLYKAKFPLIRIEAGMNCSNREVFDANPAGDRKVGPQHFFIPTLSELIEACGDGFRSLMKNETTHHIYKWDLWLANYHYTKKENMADAMGKTSSEAVAKLWLKLNDKT